MYISQGRDANEHLHRIECVCKAGVRWVQLRLKGYSEAQCIQIAKQAKKICDTHDSLLTINDLPYVMVESGADGVHLGQKDLLGSKNKLSVLSKRLLLGITANTAAHIEIAAEYSPAYIGVGPYRHTTTKENLAPILGVEGYKRLLSWMKSEGIYIPVFAVGGVRLKDVRTLIATGVYGVAVSSLLHQCDDVASTTRLVTQINQLGLRPEE